MKTHWTMEIIDGRPVYLVHVADDDYGTAVNMVQQLLPGLLKDEEIRIHRLDLRHAPNGLG
jgi:hypothetical protein